MQDENGKASVCRDRVIENLPGLVETVPRVHLLGDRYPEGPCRGVRETAACVEPGVLPDRKYANGLRQPSGHPRRTNRSWQRALTKQSQ